MAIMNIKLFDLQGEMNSGGYQRTIIKWRRREHQTGKGQRTDGASIKDRQPWFCFVAKAQRRGFYANQRIIFFVLMGVDRVIAKGPKNPRDINRDRTGAQPTHQRRITDQCSPIECQTKPGLWPIGNALHKGIGGDKSQRRKAQCDGELIKLQQYGQSHQAQKGEKGPSLLQGNFTRRDRAQRCALHLAIKVPVDNVIIRATSPAHGVRSDRKQNCVIGNETNRPRAIDRAKAKAPQTRQIQQPGSDWPIRPHQAQIGLGGFWRALHPVAGNGVWGGGGLVGHVPS